MLYNPSCNLIEFDTDSKTHQFLNLDRIIFLDFDGVLHPDGCDVSMDFCYMQNFCSVIGDVDPNFQVPIVISSMWRLTVKLDEMRSYFPKEIARQIIGVTPDLYVKPISSISWNDTTTNDGLREAEIKRWMSTYCPAGQWLAIDDRARYFSIDCQNLFLVPGFIPGEGDGITNTVSDNLKARLKVFLNQTLHPRRATHLRRQRSISDHGFSSQ